MRCLEAETVVGQHVYLLFLLCTRWGA